MALRIGDLDPTHAGAAHALTTAVGWTHRLEDWVSALAVGRGLGAFDDDGTPRGALMWFPYGSAFATIGMVAVDPAVHRGGVGRALMDRAVADAGGRSLILVSTAAGRRLYESLGFRVIGANAAHVGVAAATAPADGVEAGGAHDTPALVALDAAAQGYPREALVSALARDGEIAVVREDGVPIAFAICRLFGKGRQVGPVIARDEGQARLLIAWFLARHAGRTLRIDVPADHPALAAWLVGLGFPRGGESPFMVRGDAPSPTGPARRYALVSQAMC
ncbi:MAG: GNAT family N-acetyltransferase [Rhodospirillales bacterium]|nr:GNAT family N-acetyltransferase [Rhodospirillales bacterium]QQS13580.1 MAG: GNAT family N-acetyltransferase [Rhodospirillales bacterium]